MADPFRLFPFRRALAIDPVILPINSASVPVAVAIAQADIKAAGVTSFKMANPCQFWVYYRGWNGAQSDMPTIANKGHYIAPGAVDINTSQVPQWIAAQAFAEPGVPLPADIATAGYRLVMVYGAGI